MKTEGKLKKGTFLKDLHGGQNDKFRQKTDVKCHFMASVPEEKGK